MWVCSYFSRVLAEYATRLCEPLAYGVRYNLYHVADFSHTHAERLPVLGTFSLGKFFSRVCWRVRDGGAMVMSESEWGRGGSDSVEYMAGLERGWG